MAHITHRKFKGRMGFELVDDSFYKSNFKDSGSFHLCPATDSVDFILRLGLLIVEGGLSAAGRAPCFLLLRVKPQGRNCFWRFS